jgi:hypothetical protein
LQRRPPAPSHVTVVPLAHSPSVRQNAPGAGSAMSSSIMPLQLSSAPLQTSCVLWIVHGPNSQPVPTMPSLSW